MSCILPASDGKCDNECYYCDCYYYDYECDNDDDDKCDNDDYDDECDK